MKSYIQNQKSIKISEANEKESSLSASDFKKIKLNSNMKRLGYLLNGVGKGNDLSEEDFVNFNTSSKYLKTASLTGETFLINEENQTSYEYINPELNKKFISDLRKINQYDIIYTSTGSNNNIGACSISSKDLKYNFSSHMFKLDVKKDVNKFYLFSILKNQYGKDACDLEVPKAGIMRRGGKRFLNMMIPFPTLKSNKSPKKVEKYISLIVQNIIDKEVKIKEKDEKIRQVISQELSENQKKKKKNFCFPKISEIEKEARLDTGLYEKEFKEIDESIKNYKNGCKNLYELGFDITRGQNLQISTIGESYYSKDKLNDKFYNLIFSSNISNYSTVYGNRYLGSKRKLKTITEGDIIFCSRGAQFGRVTVFPDLISNSITNIDNMHINSENYDPIKSIFITMFLNYFRRIGYLKKIAIFGNGSFSFTQYQFERLFFPNFSKKKQKEIAKLYYFKLNQNKSLNLENYLKEEFKRNKKVGIFQLNSEIIQIKELLGEIIDKIINNKKINLNF